jgi:hypothetical protein
LAGRSPEEIADILMAEAVQAICRDDEVSLRVYVAALAERPGDELWTDEVDRTLLAAARRDVVAAWARGWQPADLARLVRRCLDTVHARVVVDVIAAEMCQYAEATVDVRWARQLESLGARQWWGRDDELVRGWQEHEGLDRPGLLRRVLELRHLLQCQAPDIGRLCPLPGEARRGSLAGAMPCAGDPRVLDRVRALLAKAESTEFAEEAEALTAKAQELMARHSIDYALLAARAGSTEEPGGIRVGVDRPYEAAKSLLLQNVAAANRCRAVWHQVPGFTTIVGYPADLEAVEMLYTSLLVQATTAMVQAGTRRDAFGRSRTRSFRQSFLDAFAIRIGERLRQSTEEVSREAATEEGSSDLLPVLAAREDKVRAAAEKLFPEVRASEVRINNRDGWYSGRAAADLATLDSRKAVADGGQPSPVRNAATVGEHAVTG